MDTLEESRIIEHTNTEGEWTLTYDISHLHKDWDALTQVYTIESQNFEGKYIYESSFSLFLKGAIASSSFGGYAKALKAKLWAVIFAVKKKFFDEVKPDIVTHFIKQPHSIVQRFALYCKWFSLPDYDIDRTAHDIVYTRTSTDFGGGFLF